VRSRLRCGDDPAALPRTEIARRGVEEGWFDGDFERIGRDYYSSTALSPASPEDRERILNLQRLFGLAVEFPKCGARSTG